MNNTAAKRMLKKSAALRLAIRMYDLLWQPVVPILRRHPRLTHGFEQRSAVELPRPSDIWIHAASAGEAYLAVELTKALDVGPDTGILLTTNTRQGLQILQAGGEAGRRAAGGRHLQANYFPFDQPRIMERVAQSAGPRVTVLIETEIWPGHLLALKRVGSRVLLINGRLTDRSLKRYRLWPRLWSRLGPDEILAVSRADAERFRRLFDASPVSVMANMKFDRIAHAPTADEACRAEGSAVVFREPFIVMGSIRGREEKQAAALMAALLDRMPQAVIGLFPRHVERLGPWQKRLGRTGVSWQLRSRVERAPAAGSIVLWDRFGELASAYSRARAAFVGGSLVPLGGQNFLEPLTAGVVPVIGPHWDNFHWVGAEIAAAGLLRIAGDWQQAAALLAETAMQQRPRARIRAAAETYMEARRGGTRQAAELVMKHLERV